ncbi:MAG: D-alanyl-D-alanine carboxypeptidase [Alphaproteobacteria bacterium]
MALLFGLSGFSSSAQAKGNPRYASIVMDADTGLILHQRYANKQLHPASLTKIMTLLLVFEALEQGKIGLKDRVRISQKAANMVPSKLGLPAGSSIRVQDAIYALVTKSANDVAVALAEHLAGSERNFALRMTNRAKDIGMSRTVFVNASGLHDKRQISTARDMAKLAQYVIKVYPDYYRYFSRKTFSYNGKSYRNHNRLMDSYDGMDGMKTGYIAASGFNLVASAVRGERRIIGVVFGGRSSKTRNAHMEELLDMGFGKIENLRIAKTPPPLPQRKPAIAKAFAALGGGQNADGKMASLNPVLQSGFEQLIGEGDFDPAASKRIETGLMAIAAHTGNYDTAAKIIPVVYEPAGTSVHADAPWSIQVGAFTSRAATDQAIQKIRSALPAPYSSGQPLIAPLKTSEGWLFRARLSGYTKEEALAACNYIRDCLPVAPQN